MSGAAANIDGDSTGGVVAPKLPGGATLPFPPTPSASIAGRTLQESTYAQRVTPPRLHGDSPNIVIVLIDDAGPGLPTTFGGEVRTATNGSPQMLRGRGVVREVGQSGGQVSVVDG